MTEQVTDGTSTETAASQETGGSLLTTPEQQATTVSTEQTTTQQADASTATTTETAEQAYEFVVPDGQSLSDDIKAELTAMAKERGYSKEQAQQFLEDRLKHESQIQTKNAQLLTEARSQWETSAKADPEFGGEKLSENLAVAKKALDQFGSPELKKLLNESGFGSHPEVIRLLFKAGKAISDDRIVTGGQAPASGVVSPQAMYAKSGMNP